MSARTAPAYSPQKAQRELEDLQLVLKARNGDSVAMDQLMRRYTGFVRLKASSYFLAGGDSEVRATMGIDVRKFASQTFLAELLPPVPPGAVRGDLRDKLDAETLSKLERLRRGQ